MATTILKFKKIEIKETNILYKTGILYEMTDPNNTTQTEIQQLCDALHITGLTWRAFGNLIWFWKRRNNDEDDEESDEDEESDDE
jgi:hypothetical protein